MTLLIWCRFKGILLAYISRQKNTVTMFSQLLFVSHNMTKTLILNSFDKRSIAYRDKSKNRLNFLCVPEFQSHHTLRLLLLFVKYIQFQRNSNSFHGLTIKTKRILGLKLGQIQVHIIMTCAWQSTIATKELTQTCLYMPGEDLRLW